jgi:MFS family permease
MEEPSAAARRPAEDAPRGRSGAGLVQSAILSVAAYRGFVEAIPGTSAAFVRESFALDEPALARLMGWIALASAGALWLGRLFDVRGRRPVLLACIAAVPVFSLLTAVAPNLWSYLATQLVLFALATAMLAGASVVMAETMPDARRAAALGRVGIADAVGGGVAIALMPLAAGLPGSWRWLWWAAVLPILGMGLLRRALPETPHWERRDAAQGLRVLFSSHRVRALHLTGSLLVLQVAFGGLLFWPYYHAVESAGLPLAIASGMVIVGGGVSLLGWVAGGLLAERFGRRFAAVAGTLVSVGCGAAFYLAPAGTPLLVLGTAYTLFLGANAVAFLATQAATLEMFPTAVRATVATGYSALAASGLLIGQLSVAALAERAGGLSSAVAWIGLLAIPGVLWFILALPETRGVTLGEAAAGDDP